jgi:hypothetical protein
MLIIVLNISCEKKFKEIIKLNRKGGVYPG